ncbi:MAG TPA: DUF4127 family protein [bacterium]|mgnify:FL=1|nr:DUF4127 family protein [bacterium]
MKIGFLPLDERPCNFKFPQYIARIAGVELILPPKEILSRKRTPADLKAIDEWLERESDNFDALVLSIDMFTYGGLIASRISQASTEESVERLEKIRDIKLKHRDLPIYAFNIIMRTSNSNNNEEEKEYWKDYGMLLFQYSELTHKVKLFNREEDKQLLHEVERNIPEEIIKDYLNGRERNHKVNLALIDLVKENIVDFALLTQDDASPYGFPAMEQKELRAKIREGRVQSKVIIYPGADEVGMLLIARAVNVKEGVKPIFKADFSSVNGPHIITRYEDRPLFEGIKGQINAVGGVLVDSISLAGIELLVNTPAIEQGEAYLFYNMDKVEGPARNLLSLEQIGRYCAEVLNMPVVLADVAYANGADLELIELLEETGFVENLTCYAGWNTSGNTLGTVIAAGSAWISGSEIEDCEMALREFREVRFIDDWLYQAKVRTDVIEELKSRGINPWQLEDVEMARIMVEEKLKEEVEKRSEEIFPLKIKRIDLPWNRLFEIDIHFEEK